jgi:hypothetical protein
MFLFEIFGWADVVLAICGLGICIAYFRLSDRMVWLVFSFAISAGAGAASRIASIAVRSGWFSQDMTVVFSLFGVGNLVASALLVFGLLGLFRELRERFQFMREAYESQPGQPLPKAVPHNESIFESTEPSS